MTNLNSQLLKLVQKYPIISSNFQRNYLTWKSARKTVSRYGNFDSSASNRYRNTGCFPRTQVVRIFNAGWDAMCQHFWGKLNYFMKLSIWKLNLQPMNQKYYLNLSNLFFSIYQNLSCEKSFVNYISRSKVKLHFYLP